MRAVLRSIILSLALVMPAFVAAHAVGTGHSTSAVANHKVKGAGKAGKSATHKTHVHGGHKSVSNEHPAVGGAK